MSYWNRDVYYTRIKIRNNVRKQQYHTHTNKHYKGSWQHFVYSYFLTLILHLHHFDKMVDACFSYKMLLFLSLILFTRNINVVGDTGEQIIEKTFCTFGGAYIVGEIWKSHGWNRSTNQGKCNIVWLNLVEDYCTILLDDKMRLGPLNVE